MVGNGNVSTRARSFSREALLHCGWIVTALAGSVIPSVILSLRKTPPAVTFTSDEGLVLSNKNLKLDTFRNACVIAFTWSLVVRTVQYNFARIEIWTFKTVKLHTTTSRLTIYARRKALLGWYHAKLIPTWCAILIRNHTNQQNKGMSHKNYTFPLPLKGLRTLFGCF